MPDLPAVRDLLPHSGPACLLTKILDRSDKSVLALGLIPGGHPLAAGRTAPAFIAVELGAQAAAAMESPGRHDAGAAPVHGRLVRIREAAFQRDVLPTDTTLEVSVHLDATTTSLAIYRMSVRADGTECATATFTTVGTRRPVAT